MPDLGPYAFEVGLAYVGSLVMLAAIILLSWMQARVSKRRLKETEERLNG